jgi:phosphoglycerate dehydrogenase-like enzyme
MMNTASANQNETIVIVSFASQNPDRQTELREGVKQLTHPRPFDLRFPVDDLSAVEALRDAEILFTWRLTEEMSRAAKRLKWVHLGGAGADQILFAAFRESDIVLTNSRGMHGTPIAEWTIAALLHISQRLSEAEAWRRDHQWKPHKQAMTSGRFILEGRRALIVGYGSVGEAIGKRLQALGIVCEGVVTSLRPSAIPLHTSGELSLIIGNFDIVVSALPLTDQTQGLFNRDLFSRMNAGSIFANVGRGKSVDESSLIEALRGGSLAFAALDVFSEEPLPENSPLFDLPNLFMTPHVSGNFPDYSRVANRVFLSNLRRHLNDEPLENVVDKQRGY